VTLLGRLGALSAPAWVLLAWIIGVGTVALVGGAAVVAGIVLAQSARRAPVLIDPPHLG
jgi:hypothetical protein